MVLTITNLIEVRNKVNYVKMQLVIKLTLPMDINFRESYKWHF